MKVANLHFSPIGSLGLLQAFPLVSDLFYAGFLNGCKLHLRPAFLLGLYHGISSDSYINHACTIHSAPLPIP